MARRKIREFDAKRIIASNINNSGDSNNNFSDGNNSLLYGKIRIGFNSILIGQETSLKTLPFDYPWLLQQKLVVKPDQLFGKRKKLGLVLLNASWLEAKEWLAQYRGREFTIGKVTDKLTHFLLEPYVPHEKEYYLALTSERDADIIHFSDQGGIDIEENWDKIQKIAVPTLQDEFDLGSIPIPLHPFVRAIFHLYRNLDFTYLEFNPFTVDEQGNIILLDTVAEVDDCASFKNAKQWSTLTGNSTPTDNLASTGNLSFPKPFGRQKNLSADWMKKAALR